MGDKTFNLTWNNHLANLSGLFEGLYKSGSLTDTTLACHGGMLRAHKLVLAACSPYFERVFKEHHGEQPILILKGVPVEEMECLLDFMYRGSINVAEEHLPSLIKTATDLEIRGLSGDERSESDNVYSRVEVEARVRSCQIESRLDNYTKMCNNAMAADCIKLEEIEVEDDPMVMESHEEDSFEESLQSSPSNTKQLIRHVPAPMFKRQMRYDGQKRVSLGRPITGRDKDNNSTKKQQRDNNFSFRDSNREENCDNDSGSPSGVDGDDGGGIKYEHGNNGALDPTVPAIQMNNEDSLLGRESMEQLSQQNSPDSESLDEPETNAAVPKKQITEVKKDIGGGQGPFGSNERKERTVLPKRDKSQYKPFLCDLCTLAFTRASHLARHRRVHTGERPFACSLCPRMFARQDKLKQHLDSHSQWPKRKSLANLTGSGASGVMQLGPVVASAVAAAKGKRGRPRKVSLDQSMIESILKSGEFSSMLNIKGHEDVRHNSREENIIELRCDDQDEEPEDSLTFLNTAAVVLRYQERSIFHYST